MLFLTKQKNKSFVILNLSDVQLGAEEWNADNRGYSVIKEVLSETIKRAKPDLISLSGDLALAGDLDAYEALADAIDEYKIPWTAVWGNHDEQEGLSAVDEVVMRYLKRSYFVYENGPSTLGRGNFVIAIKEGDKVVHGVIFMDTHNTISATNENGEEYVTWGNITKEQAHWYEEQIKELSALGCKETSVISHIPIYAYRTAFNESFDHSLDPSEITPSEGQDGKGWLVPDAFGVKHECISSSDENDMFFERLLKTGSTKNYLCGHSHINNFSIPFKGIRLTYSLKAGVGSYYQPELIGGTVLEIDKEGLATVQHHFVDISKYL